MYRQCTDNVQTMYNVIYLGMFKCITMGFGIYYTVTVPLWIGHCQVKERSLEITLKTEFELK